LPSREEVQFGDASYERQANEIIAEYATQGYDLTLRQLYYQFVSRDLVSGEQLFGMVAPAKTRPRFLVPAGTKCAVRNVIRDEWVPFTTTKPNGFERFERWVTDEGGPDSEFGAEAGGWVRLGAARHVRRRPR
jgi:hypothetical protein